VDVNVGSLLAIFTYEVFGKGNRYFLI